MESREVGRAAIGAYSLTMRASVLVVVVLGACSGDGGDWPWHGAGGGGGETVDGPDAGPAPGDGAEASAMTGRVCVIQAWDAPFDCADIGLAHDVLVEDLATGGAATTSDGDGAFVLDLVGTSGTIRVGGDDGDLLIATRSVQAIADNPVDAPVVDAALWETTLANLLETQTAGAGVVYVVDANGPVAGAVVQFTTGVPGDARRYYDDGAGGFDASALATGTDGAALMLDVTSGGVRATAEDGRVGTATLPTATLELGIAVITLPAR